MNVIFLRKKLLFSMIAAILLLTSAGCGSSQKFISLNNAYTQPITPIAEPNQTFYATETPTPSPTPSYTPTPTPTPLPPVLLTGKTELQQGDILSLRLLNVREGVKPEAETDLGMSVFTPTGSGEWYAVFPVSNTREPGGYTVSIQAGEITFTVSVTVLEFDFDRQNLVINTSSPAIIEATSPEAYQQFNDKIPPIYEIFDETRYWKGSFERPAAGRITTNFGEIRITNSDPSTARTHNGMDIAAPLGTPVFAPNAGRVVFAESMLNPGNTVIIEHGGGLKSVYYHMHSIDVSVDDMVETGTQIGTIGSTGYSTGPHLHYEIRIGNQAVSPQMLLDQNAGLYSAAKIIPNIRVFVDNAELNFEQPPIIVNDRALVPMRAIFEALGATVHWDEDTKTVEARRNFVTIRLTVDSVTAQLMDGVDSSDIILETEPVIVKDRVFVPLRFISESLGANVNWDETSKTVSVEGRHNR